MSPAKSRPQNKFNISLLGENSMLNFLLKEMCQRLQRKCVSEKVWPFQNYQEIQHGLSFLMVREDFWNNVKWNGRIQSVASECSKRRRFRFNIKLDKSGWKYMWLLEQCEVKWKNSKWMKVMWVKWLKSSQVTVELKKDKIWLLEECEVIEKSLLWTWNKAGCGQYIWAAMY